MLRYICSYSSFCHKTIMILQQWNIWACASVSMLGALKRMNPEIDHESLLKEVLADKSSQLTYQRASAWFVRKWLIKWIRPVTYSHFLAKKQPILTWLVGVDWVTTASTKNLTLKNNWEINSHFIHISLSTSSSVLLAQAPWLDFADISDIVYWYIRNYTDYCHTPRGQILD